MERVTGIGGVFFRARDPEALGRWYAEQLGVTLTPKSYDEACWWQERGPTVFNPFPTTRRTSALESPGGRGTVSVELVG